jgi:hypothetical protein
MEESLRRKKIHSEIPTGKLRNYVIKKAFRIEYERLFLQ